MTIIEPIEALKFFFFFFYSDEDSCVKMFALLMAVNQSMCSSIFSLKFAVPDLESTCILLEDAENLF